MEQQTTQSAPAIEFTYDWYRSFLDRIRDAGYDFRPFSATVDAGTVRLRHDVDLSLEDALTMARIEADHDVTATYCVLLSAGLYNPLEGEQRERVRAIESLGHDVALHFSTHEYWDADAEPTTPELDGQVAAERTVLETLVEESTETVSFHRPPPWILNRSLENWRNTYAPAYFGDVTYLADSGQRWRETPPTVRDFGEAAQVLVHPGLWGEIDATFEERIEKSVTSACLHADRKAHREFLPVEGEGR